MNTGSSVSKGTSNFFIHIVIGAMLVGTLRQSSHQKNTNCKPGFFYLNLCLLKHMIHVQYYDLHADPSRFSQISQVYSFQYIISISERFRYSAKSQIRTW